MKRVCLMPNPVKRDDTYYLFVTVPADIAARAKGTWVTIPIGETTTTTRVGTHAKASLRTKDHAEARRRFPAALAAVEAHWEALRRGQTELSHRQAVALAGEVRKVFIDAFDENPGDVAMWEGVQKRDDLAQRGLSNELQVDLGDAASRLVAMEARFGGLVDAALRRHNLCITAASRQKVMTFAAAALNEAARVNEAKAVGDYSDTGKTAKYPAFVAKASTGDAVTLDGIIDRKVEDRAIGKDANPLSETMVKKLRLIAVEFEAHHGHA